MFCAVSPRLHRHRLTVTLGKAYHFIKKYRLIEIFAEIPVSHFLFGRTNPSASMSLTFPKRLQDTPTYLTFGEADHDLVYGEGVFIGH